MDKMNNESCVKPEGASKYTPCYIAMSSTDEVYQPHEESYDCSEDDKHQQTCYRTVWSWDNVNYSYNRPRTVEINEVSLPYDLVQGGRVLIECAGDEVRSIIQLGFRPLEP